MLGKEEGEGGDSRKWARAVKPETIEAGHMATTHTCIQELRKDNIGNFIIARQLCLGPVGGGGGRRGARARGLSSEISFC